MQTNWVSELLKLCGHFAPVEQPGAEDWREIEAELNLEFPPDLKELLSVFGTGWFGSALNLSNPKASREHLRLSREGLLALREMLVDLEKESRISLFPEVGGLVCIGRMDRDYFLLAPDQNERRLEQLVWWDTDLLAVKNLEMTISQFIHHLYLGQIEEAWAHELRGSFWQNGGQPLFRPFPLQYL